MATTGVPRVVPPRSRRPTRDPAREAWAVLSEFLRLQRGRYITIASEFDLSPIQGFTLSRLEPGTPVAMHSLAEALTCDASNVTGIVDRLEARGLIERRAAEHDRRVKMLAVTVKGARLRERLLARLHEPPDEIAGLSPEDQRALREILGRALARSDARSSSRD